MTRVILRWACLVLAVTALVTCGGDDTSVGPSDRHQLVATLVSPNANDAAVVFQVFSPVGSTVDLVEVACSCQLYARTLSEREARGIVTGELQSGQAVLRVTVSGATAPSQYTFTIKQIALRTGEVRFPQEGYRFEVQ
jgi:hypothetical protein